MPPSKLHSYKTKTTHHTTSYPLKSIDETKIYHCHTTTTTDNTNLSSTADFKSFFDYTKNPNPPNKPIQLYYPLKHCKIVSGGDADADADADADDTNVNNHNHAADGDADADVDVDDHSEKNLLHKSINGQQQHEKMMMNSNNNTVNLNSMKSKLQTALTKLSKPIIIHRQTKILRYAASSE
ncbi:unnamed protein product [Schistosoma turkestanicum]|nr:unnamed protein product [Schistosoma turkestanicum]